MLDAQQTARGARRHPRRRSRLTLDDAVKFALDRNLDIAVQRLNPEINDIADREHQLGLPPDADVARSVRSRRRSLPVSQTSGGTRRHRAAERAR